MHAKRDGTNMGFMDELNTISAPPATPTNPTSESGSFFAALDQIAPVFDAGGEGLAREVPTMNLDYTLEQTEIGPDADARQALAYSIHLEKNAIEFYKCLVNGCEGAPMAPVFQSLLADESKHLRELEDLYERHFMTEN